MARFALAVLLCCVGGVACDTGYTYFSTKKTWAEAPEPDVPTPLCLPECIYLDCKITLCFGRF